MYDSDILLFPEPKREVSRKEKRKRRNLQVSSMKLHFGKKAARQSGQPAYVYTSLDGVTGDVQHHAILGHGHYQILFEVAHCISLLNM